MSLYDPHAFTVLGNPVDPACPAVLRAVGGHASAELMTLAQQQFYKHCMLSRLSVVPNPMEAGRLSDGTRYEIVTVGITRTMTVWPEDEDSSIEDSDYYNCDPPNNPDVYIKLPTVQLSYMGETYEIEPIPKGNKATLNVYVDGSLVSTYTGVAENWLPDPVNWPLEIHETASNFIAYLDTRDDSGKLVFGYFSITYGEQIIGDYWPGSTFTKILSGDVYTETFTINFRGSPVTYIKAYERITEIDAIREGIDAANQAKIAAAHIPYDALVNKRSGLYSEWLELQSMPCSDEYKRLRVQYENKRDAFIKEVEQWNARQ